jgi:hypothetical protein
MQNAEEANLGAQVFRITGHFEKRFGAGPEQQIVNNLLILQSDRGQLVGQSENHMRVACGQEFTLPGGEPAAACSCLTLWAMPVTARVEGDGTMAAGRTFIDVTAERGGATTLDGRERLQMLPRQGCAMPVNKARSNSPDNIGHL